MKQVLKAGVSGFTDVDACDAQAYIAYLDACAGNSQGRPALYAAQGIASGMSVLDLGCGTGDHCRALSEFVGERGRVAGVDSSRAMAAEAQRRGVPSNTSFGVASAYALPFVDETFDAVRAERVFQHLEHPDVAAQELQRVLKPGGSVLLVDQDWESITVTGGDAVLTRRMILAFADSLANGRAGKRHTATLSKAGFRDVRVASGVTALPFSKAYTSVLESAGQAARLTGAVTALEAETWLSSLAQADRHGTFSYGVSVFVAVAVK